MAQPDILIKLYEFDSSKPLDVGRNPIPIATTKIPFVERYPRRERAALDALKTYCGDRKPVMSHTPNNEIIAIVHVTSTTGAGAPTLAAAPPRADAQQAIAQLLIDALRSPDVVRALQGAMKGG